MSVTSSPPIPSLEHRNDTVQYTETQPLIDHETNIPDEKEEPNTQHVVTAVPRAPSPLTFPNAPEHYAEVGNSPIRLESPEESGPPRCFRNIRPENQSICDDMTRGVLMIVTTPVALAGMALYSCGVIIEGIALMLKGVGSLGGRLLMRRRRSEPNASDPQWV